MKTKKPSENRGRKIRGTTSIYHNLAVTAS